MANHRNVSEESMNCIYRAVMLAHQEGDNRVSGAHILAAMLHAHPDRTWSLLVELGLSEEDADALSEDPDLLWRRPGRKLGPVPLEPEVEAALAEGPEGGHDKVELEDLARLVYPKVGVSDLVRKRRGTGGASGSEPERTPPFRSNREYLHQLREVWRLRASLTRRARWSEGEEKVIPVPGLPAGEDRSRIRRSLVEQEEDFARRCGVTSTGTVVSLAWKRAAGMPPMEAALLDAAILVELDLLPLRSSLRSFALALDPEGFPRHCLSVVEAAGWLEDRGFLARSVPDHPPRLFHLFGLQEAPADDLLRALRNDPLAGEEVRAARGRLGPLSWDPGADLRENASA